MGVSCCLIGEDSLLIQCGNILLARGHSISLVVSPIKSIQSWSKKNDIPFIGSIQDISKFFLNKIDYMFSIVNSQVLSNEIIKLCRNPIINYHDSALPKYAGLNATSWAILNNEKVHGVTWHIVNDKIDSGDIVRQNIFPIEAFDTAFTLNLRCYEQAIHLFKMLVVDIEGANLTLLKQDLLQRSYFGSKHMLPNLGFIDWENFTAEFIIRMSRALTFGHYNNNLGSLKIFIGNSYLIVSHVEISSRSFQRTQPGTILDIHSNALYISTNSQAIKIGRFISRAGKNLAMAEVMQLYGLKLGFLFPTINVSNNSDLKNFYACAVRSEKFWISQLNYMTEHTVFSPKEFGKNHLKEEIVSYLSIDGSLEDLDINAKKTHLLAVIIIYLYRLNNYDKTSVSLLLNGHEKTINMCGNLFSSLIPVTVDWNPGTHLCETIEYLSNLIVDSEKNHTYFTDISARHPLLEGNILESGITINLTGELKDISLPWDSILYFQFDEKRNLIQIHQRVDPSNLRTELKQVIPNLVSHLTTILRYVINEPHVPVSSICFLAEGERKKLLTVWGRGQPRQILEESIITLFEKKVLAQPLRPAITMYQQTVSYGQLWELAERIAIEIRHMNIPPQTLIGIFISRSINMLAAILGILKANCVYLPLDTKYPLLKIEAIVNESHLSHLITSEDLFSDIARHFKKIESDIELYSVEKILEQNTATDGGGINDIDPDNLAYIMFTSGTTGAPKGVMVTQKNVINYCYWFAETNRFTSSSIIDFSSSIAFDLSIPCTIAPLLFGGQIAICDDAGKTNPQFYLRHLKNNKVSHAELTPGYLEMLLNYPNDIRKLTDLKFLLLGADIVPTSDVRKWLSLCPNHQIVNEYGPTETTVSVTSFFVNNEAITDEPSIPIGRPAYNTSCYILDKYKNLCPEGIKGELYIGGFQVANGYLGKERITQEKFIVSSVDTCEDILYKTGDLVRWLPDGNLQFFGRNDHQVKMHGYRVELTGIEAILMKVTEINQAVVVVKKGHFKERYLRAYLVFGEKKAPLNEIKSFLSAHFPSYMIPKEFCDIPSIPLKENEKIDFDALERQPRNFLTYAHHISEDLTAYEQITMRIWQHAFNTTAITIDDDFFDIGGDSLLALQIITDLNKHYNLSIPLYYLFDYPTIYLLSRKLVELEIAEIQPLAIGQQSPITAIIKLSTGSDPTPLFLVHPVGGTIFWYKQLAGYFAGKYTIYGIQDPNNDGHSINFNSLESMANYYLDEIESVYSGDHYRLGGASFGATVAFEMAQQLIKKNKKIDFLGLLDGWAEYPEEILDQNSDFILSNKDNTMTTALDTSRAYLIDLERYRKILLGKYKLMPIDADVHLFKASELWSSFSTRDESCNGWQAFVKGVLALHKVPGNHETMFFYPNVCVLAQQIMSIYEQKLL